MRILLSCLQGETRHAMPAHDYWRGYFKSGLEEAGHEVLEVPGLDWAEGTVHRAGIALDAWRARAWQMTLDFARRESGKRPIDLFLGYLFPGQIDTGAIAELQRRGIPCVNFFCDNIREFRKVPAEYRPFALHWVPEHAALAMYRDATLPYIQAPMPCWIPAELRTASAIESEPPTFIGSSDLLRRALLGRAIEAGAELVLRGHGWLAGPPESPMRRAFTRKLRPLVSNQWELVRKDGVGALLIKVGDRLRPLRPAAIPRSHVGSPVNRAEYIRISREAVVTLGISRVPTARASNRRPLLCPRLRDIEAPMLGACYLTEATDELQSMYEFGSEVEIYRTADELCRKLAELKRDPRRRLAMRQRAQRRALADHSVPRTIARIGAQLGLPVR